MFSGYNSRWALPLVDQIQDTHHSLVRLVTILFGSNDCALLSTSPRQHVPIPEYTENMKEIIARVQASCPHAKIILMTPPPICEVKLTNGSRTNEEAGMYAAAARQVAIDTNVVCLDLWTKMQETDTWRELLNDGLHLSTSGGKFVGEHLLEVIEAEFPEISVTPCQVTGRPGNSGSSSQLPHDAPWQDSIVDMVTLKEQFILTPPLYINSRN